MLGAGRRSGDEYFHGAILRARSTAHLAVRLAVRANQLLLASGAAGPGAGWRRAALAAFVVLDLAVWHALRRSDSFGLRWRLPLDLADMAFWALSPEPASRNYDYAVLISLPLALEAGFRFGARALALPGVIALVVGAARVANGDPLLLMPLVWPAMATAMGEVLWRYCATLYREADRRHAQRAEADSRRAYLGGQNSVAMGAASVVDAIEGLVPVLGRPRPGSALWQLADGWKASLGRRTAREAAYLQVAVLEWERRHNCHPDLSWTVQAHVGEGDGTVILTGSQVGHLWDRLDHMRLRGRVVVEVERGAAAGAHVPGRRLDLVVNEKPVGVPADSARAPRAVDPGPSTYLFLTLVTPVGLLSTYGGSAWPVIAVTAAAYAAAGVWSHRRLAAMGEAGRRDVFLVAAGVALAMAALGAPTLRQTMTPDGDPIYAISNPMLLVVFLGAFYHSSLRRPGLVVPAAVAGVVTVGILLSPAPPTLGSLLATIVWSTAPYFPARRVSIDLGVAASQYAMVAAEENRRAIDAAFAEGRESVIALVRMAHQDARRQLESLGDGLPDPVQRLVTTRIEEVERRLATL